ncbi:MAG: undecaprenyl-diphosphate phosphatase [Phycisphaeraceae bacterium]
MTNDVELSISDFRFPIGGAGLRYLTWGFVLLLVPMFASAQIRDPQSAIADSPEPRIPNPESRMSVGQAIILGLVEGVTEYLPVSSTGHLIVVQRMMGIGNGGDESAKQAADAYAICIQGGAILAVLLLYARRAKQMGRGVIGRDPNGRRLLINIIAGFVPAAVIGLATHKYIEKYLMGGQWDLWPTVAAWFVGGAAILAVAWWRKAHREGPAYGKSLEQLAWKAALLIGFLQCIAMWPGVSRSLVTIVAGVLVGLSLPAAVEFSFLLGVVTLGAATLYDGMKHGELMLHTYGPVSLIVGFVVAAISAALAVKWMVAYLNKHGLQLFGYYRIAAAVIVAALLWWKVI